MSRSQRTLNAYRANTGSVRSVTYDAYAATRALNQMKESKRVASMLLNAFNDFQVYGGQGNDHDFAGV